MMEDEAKQQSLLFHDYVDVSLEMSVESMTDELYGCQTANEKGCCFLAYARMLKYYVCKCGKPLFIIEVKYSSVLDTSSVDQDSFRVTLRMKRIKFQVVCFRSTN